MTTVVSRSLRKCFKIVLVAISGAVVPAFSETRQIERLVVEAFLGHCLQNLPDLNKLKAASKVFGWSPLAADQAAMLRPTEPNATFEGWVIRDQGTTYLVGISDGVVEGQHMLTCTLASGNFDQPKLIDELNKKINLKYLNDEKEAGQRYRAWTTIANSQNLMIILTTDQVENIPGGTLSALVKAR